MSAGKVNHKKGSFISLRKMDASYLKNTEEVNLFIQKIIFATMAIPLVLMILTKIGFYVIDPVFLKELFALSFAMSVCSVILVGVNTEKVNRFVVYFQICACALYIAFMGSTGQIRVFITYALVPFLSCMYYRRKATIITSIFGYFSMVVSIIYRSRFEHWYSPFSEHEITQREWLITALFAFSAEYIVSFLGALSMSKKLKTDYDQLINDQNKVDELKLKLNQERDSVFEANDEIVKNTYRLYEIQDQIILFVGEVLGSHDDITRKHIKQVKIYVGMIANDLREHGFYRDQLTDEKIRFLEMGAFLHDIGKVHVPKGILRNAENSNPREYNLMKTHAEEGKKLLDYLPLIEEGRFNKVAIEMAYNHHEWWNGNGYPRGISGESIPLEGRIMAAADLLDTTIARSEKKFPESIEDAMKVFGVLNGKQIEPCIAESVIRCKNQIMEINRPLLPF